MEKKSIQGTGSAGPCSYSTLNNQWFLHIMDDDIGSFVVIVKLFAKDSKNGFIFYGTYFILSIQIIFPNNYTNIIW